jgi:hypothetical protein
MARTITAEETEGRHPNWSRGARGDAAIEHYDQPTVDRICRRDRLGAAATWTR